MRARPEAFAALVNTLLVTLVPIAVSVGHRVADNSFLVRPPSTLSQDVFEVVAPVALFSPFSFLAGWRTFVHAQRYRQDPSNPSTVLKAILEPGSVGLAIGLLVLTGGILSNPHEAAPYIVVYGGGAIVVGFTIGVVLSLSGVIAVKIGEKLLRKSSE